MLIHTVKFFHFHKVLLSRFIMKALQNAAGKKKPLFYLYFHFSLIFQLWIGMLSDAFFCVYIQKALLDCRSIWMFSNTVSQDPPPPQVCNLHRPTYYQAKDKQNNRLGEWRWEAHSRLMRRVISFLNLTAVEEGGERTCPPDTSVANSSSGLLMFHFLKIQKTAPSDSVSVGG